MTSRSPQIIISHRSKKWLWFGKSYMSLGPISNFDLDLMEDVHGGCMSIKFIVLGTTRTPRSFLESFSKRLNILRTWA